MHAHHEESIANVDAHFRRQPEVEALLLGGSIAHGFASPASDVDVMIVVSDAHHADRHRRGDLNFFSREPCTYPDGYVDGKYISPAFLRRVAESGSEPARFAFQDARVLFSRIDSLDQMLHEITRYPAEGRIDRMRRFRAQLDAWNWYTGEALRLNNRYLLSVSLGRLVLFAGRLILAHNKVLYPYHKWFLEVLSRVEDKPTDLLDRIHMLYDDPSTGSATALYECVKDFQDWPEPATTWSAQFMLDSELTWLTGSTPVDDL
jgi:nucleotidyltransferase-like protein